MDGMKVTTRSEKALKYQRSVMEFLLINHPLDCPICDQGGECELQDVSLGYGRSVSRFNERKRVVPDEDIGPLVATEMTRCIQCTRCVRFTADIAGTYELGGMYRGENLQIGTYDGKPLTTEISGNVIDVCPVGALTNKVFQFRARPWELMARESLGYHDAMGSNLFLHVRRGEVLRTVPRENEAVNECWLSDRDRYSHQGLYAEDRAVKPLKKVNGEWTEVSWTEGLAAATQILRDNAGDQLGVLVHPSTSNEEGALLARLAEGWAVAIWTIVCPIATSPMLQWPTPSPRRWPRSNRPTWWWCSVPTCAMSCRCCMHVCARRTSRTAPRFIRSIRSISISLSPRRAAPWWRRRSWQLRLTMQRCAMRSRAPAAP